MWSKAENPSVGRTASCRYSWQPPGEKPEDCQNRHAPFKSTPPFAAWNPASFVAFSGSPSRLTGQQCQDLTERNCELHRKQYLLGDSTNLFSAAMPREWHVFYFH